MNPVLLLTRNNVDLSRRCVESIRNQDISTYVYIVDNGSTDGTQAWISGQPFNTTAGIQLGSNRGVSFGWNFALKDLFDRSDEEHVLVVGNDTILPRYCYSALLSANVPFVTGVDVGMDALPEKPDVFPLSPHPDFSCFLIRRECWETVGPFDERMTSYASDCAYHVEAHRKGIPLYKASVPYNHERSSTLNRASSKERGEIQLQANKDRAVFRELYGCLPGTKEYEALFG